MMNLRILGVLFVAVVYSTSSDGQEISIPPSETELVVGKEVDCDNLIYAAREMYNRGELEAILEQLTPCADEEDLLLRQRRTLYRLLAESHLFLRQYAAASEYARLLVEIDPRLQVYGISRLQTKGKKNLRTAIQSSRYVDSPDLLLLVGNIRYRAIGAEIFGGLSKEFISVHEVRLAPGVSEVTDQEWSGARRSTSGVGIKYDPYHFPLSISLKLSLANASSSFSANQISDGDQSTLTYMEKQKWMSPELWLGYQFAPRTFPVKLVDFSFRAGFGLDILTGATLEGATLARGTEIQWYGGQERDIKDLIEQKIYPVIAGAFAVDYRFGRQSVFGELQYKRSFMDKYVYDLPAAPFASSVRSVHRVGVQLGIRYVFYKAFYK